MLSISGQHIKNRIAQRKYYDDIMNMQIECLNNYSPKFEIKYESDFKQKMEKNSKKLNHENSLFLLKI